MNQLQSTFSCLIIMGAIVLITLYGPPVVEVTTPTTTFSFWGRIDLVPIFWLVQCHKDKNNSK